jgi:hypothetical protein
VSDYDPYAGVPFDLRPTRADEAVLSDIVRVVKEAFRIRHDYDTALQISDRLEALKQKFIPAIVSGRPATRRLAGAATPAWESNFAKSARPDAKIPSGLAAAHAQLALEAKSYVARLKGNARLARLVRDNLVGFFPSPSLGYSPTGGVVRRLVRRERSVLRIFHPLGVEDIAKLIRLMVRRRPEAYIDW